MWLRSNIHKLSYAVVGILNLIWILNRYVYSLREAFLTIMISFLVLAVGCFLRRMGKNVALRTAVRQTVWAVFVYYCFVLYAVLISRGLVFSRDYGSTLNLIPFRMISQELDGFSLRFSSNLFGNIILFIPLGIMLPVLRDGLKRIYICVPVICFCSFFVEVIQYLTHSGSADADDIILNTAGGLIGFVLYKIGSLIIKIGRRDGSLP